MAPEVLELELPEALEGLLAPEEEDEALEVVSADVVVVLALESLATRIVEPLVLTAATAAAVSVAFTLLMPGRYQQTVVGARRKRRSEPARRRPSLDRYFPRVRERSRRVLQLQRD